MICAVFLVGCGVDSRDGRRAGTGAPTVERVRTVAPARDDSFALPFLGKIAAACRPERAYVVRFTAAPDQATVAVRVAVGGRPTRSARVDPGRTLTLRVPTIVRHTSADTFHDTPPIRWEVAQNTEAWTITARVAMTLSDGTQGAGSCTFSKLQSRLATRLH